MLNPCFRHVLCPPGTGTDTPGVNYSSEHVDVPEYNGYDYPVSDYGYYTACNGRCTSIVSQEEADLCAQRLSKICLNQTGGPGGGSKNTYGNTPQVCTDPSQNRLVIVQAGTFSADSIEEANAQAVSYAIKQQHNPDLPTGVVITPPPGGGGPFTPPSQIPIGVPPPTRPPPPPPASTCKPCDDTVAVGSFTLDFDVPSDTQVMIQDSPILKCGTWQFCINTISGGPLGYPADVSLTAIANDPGETLQWAQTMFNIPCGSDPGCSAADTPSFGFEYCCGQTCSPSHFPAVCEETSPTVGFLTKIRAYYTATEEFLPPRHFTITGTLIAPP